MRTKTRGLIVLIEMDNGDVHQVIMTTEQENAIKALLRGGDKPIQVMSTPLDLKIERADKGVDTEA